MGVPNTWWCLWKAKGTRPQSLASDPGSPLSGSDFGHLPQHLYFLICKMGS